MYQIKTLHIPFHIIQILNGFNDLTMEGKSKHSTLSLEEAEHARCVNKNGKLQMGKICKATCGKFEEASSTWVCLIECIGSIRKWSLSYENDE